MPPLVFVDFVCFVECLSGQEEACALQGRNECSSA